MKLSNLLQLFRKPKLVHNVWYCETQGAIKFYFQYNANNTLQVGIEREVNTRTAPFKLTQVKKRIDKRKCYLANTGIVEKLIMLYMRKNFNYRQGEQLIRPFENLPKTIVLLKNSFTFDTQSNTLRCGKHIVMQEFEWSRNR